MKGIVLDIETKGEITNREDFSNIELTVCGWYDYESGESGVYEQNELDKLWEKIQKAGLIIGYNSDFFDVPILQKYTSVNLTSIKQFDILREIKKSLGRRIPLDWVADGTLGEKKIGSGMDAIKWWAEGKKDKVKEYCLKDVDITRRVFDYIIKHKNLKYIDSGISFEIKMDISEEEYAPRTQNAILFGNI